ncbi:hypothetical protein [Streptomyces sp. NBC_00564]|uniref:hypothetical protein n=1 Tax=Streptomyces sp. NBC_00564 TaxID=2903663 RepID=UPI00352E4A6D|nr:hypothetical protein OG256_29180 [Streptomyces sp. NBC_00564]
MKPLSAAELTAALPRDGSLPGYSVTSTPESSTDGSTSDPDVRPEACRPLWDARAGASATSVARAWVSISPSGFAPPTESLTFASYDSDSADAHLASLDKALDACPSLSFLSRYGDRVTADIERVASQVTLGDASVSFRMHWTADLNGFKSDTFSLITTVRTGEATVTAVSDSSVGSQLSASKKRAFMPKLDHDMLKSQADALRKAQVR